MFTKIRTFYFKQVIKPTWQPNIEIVPYVARTTNQLALVQPNLSKKLFVVRCMVPLMVSQIAKSSKKIGV
jgi:hypothetical protein